MPIIWKYFLVFSFALLPIYSFSQNVYVTQTGQKFHKENCHYLKHSKKEIPLQEAKEQGYSSCKVCFASENAIIINDGVEQNQSIWFDWKLIGSSALLLTLPLFYWYRRKQWAAVGNVAKGDLTDLDLKVLTELLEEVVPMDTLRLNTLLSLEQKSLDSQRKARAKYIHELNSKLLALFNVNEAVVRQNALDDGRIVHYALNPDAMNTLKSQFSSLYLPA